MKFVNLSILGVVAIAGFAARANAQFPDDNVTSDSCANTAVGKTAMGTDTAGCAANDGTAVGSGALYSDSTDGDSNTGVGFQALYKTTGGSSNVAVGANALHDNLEGSYNTGIGAYALSYSAGNYNTATGGNALAGPFVGQTGSYNTAMGFNALTSNFNGYDNTASGYGALADNTGGYKNIADGVNALNVNTTGNNNTAIGVAALVQNTSGSTNIAIGYHGGGSLTTGSNNIDIGSAGVAAESGIIRIGTPGTQTQTYIAGIEATKITGSAVYVTSSGELGVLASSERYKTAIAPMREATDKLQQLRPVSFHLKTEPAGALQYGLIAEEVAQVYPELVTRDAAGTIQGVRYDELAPMLLNEVQQQRIQLEQQAARQQRQAAELKEMRQLKDELQDTRRQVSEQRDVNQSMQAAILDLQVRGPADRMAMH